MATMEKINFPILYVNMLTGKKINFIMEGGCLGMSIEDEKVYRPHFSFAIT